MRSSNADVTSLRRGSGHRWCTGSGAVWMVTLVVGGLLASGWDRPAAAKTHPVIVGDLDLDGAVDVRDLQCFRETLGAEVGQAPACLAEVPALLDVNCDGGIDSADVSWVLARAGGWLPDPAIDSDGDWRPDACDWDDDDDGFLDTCEAALGTAPDDAASTPDSLDDCPPPCLGGCPDTGTPCLVAECEEDTGLCDALPASGPCDDDDHCTIDDACLGGTCEGQPKDCSGLDEQCSVGLCEPASGSCVLVSASDAAPCDDGDACTLGTTCAAGDCVGGAPVDCPVTGPCTAPTCDPVTGCLDVAIDDGVPCFDEALCSEPGSCLGGSCDCPAPDCTPLDDECHLGAFDPVGGGCITVPNPGAPCNADFNACSLDTCSADGTCIAGQLPDCSHRDDACNTGICSPVTAVAWVCSALPDPGKECSDATECSGGVETCQPPALAAWGFDHASVIETKILDHAGGGYHGVPNTGAWLAEGGPSGHVLACDGIDSEVLVDDHPALALDGQAFSMASHFRADDGGVFSQVILARDGSYMMGTNAGFFSCAVKVDDSWAWYGSGAVSSDTWHHGGCTFDGSWLRIYLDGAMTDAIFQPGQMTPQPGPLRMCAREVGLNFGGDLANTRLFTRVLDTGEMWSLYAEPEAASGSSTCGGGIWDAFCCETDAHCADKYGCTADLCDEGLCDNSPAFPCDLPGNGCFFEFCEDNPATGKPWCNGNTGGYGTWAWSVGFETWETAGTHSSGWQLLTAASASSACTWNHVSTDELVDNVLLISGGCPEGESCLYVGNTDTWNYDHGTCDAGLYAPAVQIPSAGEAWLQVSYWAEISDAAPGKDRLELHVDGSAVSVKDGSQLYTFGQWMLLTVDMSAYADGESHEISLHFRTGDGAFNTGTGVVVDDFRLWMDDPTCQ